MKISQAQNLDETYEALINVALNNHPLTEIEFHIDPNFMGYGTALDEKLTGWEGFKWMVERQRTELAENKAKIKRIPLLKRTFSQDNSAFVVEEIEITIDLGQEIHGFTTRLSTLLEYHGGKWMILHFHGSTADADTPEGNAWPIEEWKRRNAELTRIVEAKTVDLVAKNRELEIEAALERVRARAMGMQSSEELSDLIIKVFQELQRLDMQLTRCLLWIFNPKDNSATAWMTNSEDPNKADRYDIPDHDHPAYKSYLAGWKNKESKWQYDLKGKEKGDWDEILVDGYFGKLPDHIKKAMKAPERVILSGSFNKFGIIQTAGLESLSNQNLDILKRFSHVFEQTYTRFLDLQIAEAQAREARIEVALERVRSKAMTMHSSEDLSDTVDAFFSELELLNVKPRRCGVGIIDRDSRKVEMNATATSADRKTEIMTAQLTLSGHPILNEIFDSYILQKEYYPVLRGKEIQEYYQAMNPEVAYPDTTKNQTEYGYYFFFKEGGVFAWTNEELSQRNIEIFRRFNSVLSLTYRRYIDLVEAEKQALEARIEAALERARAQSMMMQHSDELNRTCEVFHDQLNTLGINSEFSYLWLPNEENLEHLFWATWKDDSGSDPSHKSKKVIYPLDKTEPSIAACYVAWESGLSVHTNPVKSEDVEDYFASWTELLEGVEKFEAKLFPDGLFYIDAYMKFGCFGIMIRRLLSDSEQDILRRFSNEFERAYTRFLDLQKAEAQAREAQIETALEKVRSRTMAMQHSDELPDAANNLFLQVQSLGIPAWSAGYCIWENEDKNSSTAFMSSEGVLQKPFSIPTSGVGYDFYNPLQKGETFHVEELGGEEIVKHYEFMRTLPIFGEVIDGIIEAGFPLPTFQTFHIVYFPQGYLMFITYERVPHAFEIFKRFAKVFEQTYTRFLDLQTKEEQAVKLREEKQRLEKTLHDLQITQAQLIQSEKMASLGELTAGIAHEIQNPLNFVNNFSEINTELIQEIKEERVKSKEERDVDLEDEFLVDLEQNMEKINHHGKRADAIVKGMLQHSRTSTGEKVPTDINELADEYLRLAYHGLRAKDSEFNAEFEADLDPNLPKVNVIPQDIGRVLLNLFNNAFQACAERLALSEAEGSRSTCAERSVLSLSKGSRSTVDEKSKLRIDGYAPKVTVKTRVLPSQEDDGGLLTDQAGVEITVTDNGSGIPEDLKDKIFQPFFTTKPTGQGTGLGLSLSYDIVKAHGGELIVSSISGEGTTFTIVLPN